MSGYTKINDDSLNDFVRTLAGKLKVKSSMIMPFVDYQEAITGFLNYIGRESDRLIVAGHASPEIEIAADRAGMGVDEALGFSPFVGHADDVLEKVSANTDTVYLANPNTVTGSNFSLKDIDRIAERIANGKLIIDEKYYDFYGISGLSLLEKHQHIVILRSLTAGFGLDSDTSGFIVGSQGLISGFTDVFRGDGISKTLYRILSTTMASEDARTQRLTSIHDESLRIANKLTEMGVQNRITAADFLLLRVADPARVGNFLAKYSITLTNLDGYPELKNYMRYRVQSPLSNDNLLDGFRRMPKDYYHIKKIDKRAVLLRRPASDTAEPTTKEIDGIDETTVVDRARIDELADA